MHVILIYQMREYDRCLTPFGGLDLTEEEHLRGELCHLRHLVVKRDDLAGWTLIGGEDIAVDECTWSSSSDVGEGTPPERFHNAIKVLGCVRGETAQ